MFLLLVWCLNSVRDNFPEILLLRGFKVAAIASVFISSFKAGKRRNSRDSCTHSFDNIPSNHNLPYTLVGIGIWLTKSFSS